MKHFPLSNAKRFFTSFLLLILLNTQFSISFTDAQTINKNPIQKTQFEKISPIVPRDVNLPEIFSAGREFRVEKLSVSGGAELITIFADLPTGNNANSADSNEVGSEVPLVSVLRDTLGDENSENDRLRYVWVHNFSEPSLKQKIASGVPFLYKKVGTNNQLGNKPPKPLMDLNPSDKNAWDKVFWLIFKQLALSQANPWVRTATLQYKNNQKYAKQTALMSALALLMIFQAKNNEKILSDAEIQDIHAKIRLSDKFAGSLMQRENYNRVYQKSVTKISDNRGHNWELLRQYCDRQQLYFEPLQMPDGSATHAIVWIAEEDLKTNRDKSFDARFLNIKNPWKDARLNNWQGYKEIRYYDDANRQVAPDDANGKPKTMIPLAIYGLDFPKIPALLVDFRNNQNPRNREISKRLLNDLTGNLLAVSTLGNLPYFFGRSLYDFVTSRRGIDINQASRSSSYSQLKLLLLLNESLDKNFKGEITNRLEKVSINPLNTDSTAKVEIAKRQYANLVVYAKRSDGLPKKIESDRREEMVGLKHNRRDRMLFAAAHLFSFGFYTHREQPTEELSSRLEIRRELEFHERYLRQTADVSARPEIDTDLDAVKKSLVFIAEKGQASEGKTAKAITKIFNRSNDQEIRQLALSCLDKMNNSTAKKELWLIYQNNQVETQWRNQSAGYLNLAPLEERQISADNEK